ncbi:MAG: non-canonical purine NTP pyrophosphatase, partial [Spirochaetales bacterium]|nr:non-canonical purine NTP pyrophosphatase [Spirochaetales bacterium]
SIIEEELGINGFGYDPIFFLKEKGCTTAQLPEGEKNMISHRGRAAAKLRLLLNSIRGESR